MPEAVIIRPASKEDLAPMAELLRTLFSLEEDFTFNAGRVRIGLEMLLASEQALALVAEVDKTVVGMCSGQLTISTAEGGPAVLVEDVVVRQGWRGQGIGKKLIETLTLWAKTHEVSRLQLLADTSNESAIDFYMHTGWSTTQLTCLRRQTI